MEIATDENGQVSKTTLVNLLEDLFEPDNQSPAYRAKMLVEIEQIMGDYKSTAEGKVKVIESLFPPKLKIIPNRENIW